jgi:hypothetical protein
VVDLGVGPILPDKDLIKGVAYYFHDSEANKVLRVVSVKFPDLMTGGEYKSIPGFTGPKVKAAEVTGVEFPQLLDPVDDLPPATLVTSVRKDGSKVLVRGVTTDNGEVASVRVNGKPAKIVAQRAGVADWEIALEASGADEVTAKATDKAGNAERTEARAIAK